MEGDVDFQKFASSYMVNFIRRVVVWKLRLEKCVVLFTVKAKFITITEACKELLWMKFVFLEFDFKQNHFMLFCDNQSVIHRGKSSTFHAQSKHNHVRYHWIQDVLNSKLMKLEKVHIDDNDTNIMTKALFRKKHETC